MMYRFFKPMRGCRIFASEHHMTKPAGELIGWCEKVDGNICIFKPPCSLELDRFIWRHRDGLNPWYHYSA
ncbi:hypothetical protein IPC367_27325 [Pseudomonas aeruginosa]|uniref:Uncharacterized protein n=1 Tax=Pseudomonas aeruginosa TaxID=287 RepID=A0A7M2ZK87_PSEAI|nr:hypothetical protein DCS61_12475 [Pseudomonas aeruginosa]OPD71393.1 hypothetical protein AO899_32970 [Pseudomonas aeruginosa]OPD83984.1 hypothetical protein AO943_36575 [Pseudomonas aeruginosa]OPD95015.1 hypothetical protein AO983_32845 [Pseudomonas aeruginosa]OPE07921.1 hypothetical protein APA55_32100 [Pseudomonas aeruginosa]